MADYNLGTAQGRIVLDYDGSGITAAERQTRVFKSSTGQLRDEMGRYVKSAQGAEKGTAAFRHSMQRTSEGLGTIAQTTGIVGGAIALGLGYAAKSAIDFEKQIDGIGAVTGATQQDIEALRQKALQLGADTSFSASESAMAMEELAKAGVPLPGILNGAADATVALAAAGGVELPKAAEIASNAMNQFSISAADMPGIADLIAGAANASAISVEDFGYSLSQVGAVANLAGATFGDTATAIALMGQAGIKGSDAGTSLKTMLQNLQPSTEKQKNLMRELGIVTEDGANRFYDAQGNLKSLASVSGILQTALAGQTKAQQSATLETLFGSDAIRAAAVFSKEGATGFNEMAAAMGNVSAESVANARLDNVAGSIERMKGSLETAAIQIGTLFLPAIRAVADFIGQMSDKFGALDPKWQKFIAFGAAAAAALLLFVAAVTGVAAVVAGVAAALGGGAIAAAVAGIAAGVALLGAALVVAYQKSEGFRNAVGAAIGFVKAIIASLLPILQGLARGWVAIFKQIGEIAQSVFARLQPAFAAIGDFIQSRVVPGFQKLSAAFQTAMPFLLQVGQVLMSVVGGAFKVLASVLGFIIPIILRLAGPVFSLLIDAIAFLISGIPKLGPIISAIGGFLMMIGKVILGAVIAPFLLLYKVGQAVFTGIMALVSTLVGWWNSAWATVAPVVIAVFNAVKSVITTVIGVIISVITGIYNFVAPILTAIAGVFRSVFGLIWTIISTVFTIISALIRTAVQGWMIIISAVMNAIVGFIGPKLAFIRAVFMAVWNGMVAFLAAVWNGIKAVVSAGVALITRVVQTWIGWIRAAWTAIWSFFGPYVKGAWNAIKSAVSAGVSAVTNFIKGGINFWKSVFSAAWNTIKSLASSAWAAIKGIVSRGVSAIVAVINGVKAIVDKVRGFFNQLKAAASGGTGSLISFVGTIPGKVMSALGHLGGLLVSAGGDLIRGLINGISGMAGAVMAKARSIADGVKNTIKGALGIHSPSRVMIEIGKYIGAGLVKGLTGTLSQIRTTANKMAKYLYDAVDAKKLRESSRKGLQRYLNAQQGLLEKQVALRQKTADKLKAANANLAALQKASADLNAGIAQKIRDQGKIVLEGEQFVTPSGIIKRVGDALAAAKKFQSNIQALIKRGVSADVVRQIAESGPTAGGAVAQALVRDATDAQIKQLNSMNSQLGTAAGSVGKTVADNLYAAGIRSAQGIVKGLQSQQKAIEKEMLKIATAMQKAIKKALKIKSPSRVFAEIGQFVTAGLAGGISGSAAQAIRAVRDLSSDVIGAVPGSAIGNLPLTAGGAASAASLGTTTTQEVNVTVHAPQNMDPNEVGTAVARRVGLAMTTIVPSKTVATA
jgi:TP901 family phage tail tape measure protein